MDNSVLFVMGSVLALYGGTPVWLWPLWRRKNIFVFPHRTSHFQRWKTSTSGTLVWEN